VSVPHFDGFEVWMEASPSFYLIRPEPTKNFGVSTVRLTFYVKGAKGAVQWMIGTEWGIEPTRAHLARFGWFGPEEGRKPTGWDLGYHAHEPQYEGHSKMGDDCELTGGACYYDGSGLNADLLIEGFLAQGTSWLWPKLIEVYRHYFEGAAWPDFTATYRPHPDEAKPALSKALEPAGDA
jgi:hypothetical protein